MSVQYRWLSGADGLAEIFQRPPLLARRGKPVGDMAPGHE